MVKIKTIRQGKSERKKIKKSKKGLSIIHLCRYTMQVSKECYFVKTEMKRTVRVGTFTNKTNLLQHGC